MHHRNERTLRELLRIHPAEHPVSIQLFGHDPGVMRSAAAIAAEAGADLIDINMGCPVRKVCGSGAGASLIRSHLERLGLRGRDAEPLQRADTLDGARRMLASWLGPGRDQRSRHGPLLEPSPASL